MLFTVIIILAVAMVVGPVLMMRPTPAQKNQERLRAAAFAKGIRVAVRNLPQQASEIEKSASVPVYFFVPHNHKLNDDWFLLRTSYSHDIHFLHWWEWRGDMRASDPELAVLKQYLPALPESVRALSVGGQGVCIYWQERGGEKVLHQIIELLEALNALQIQPD